MTPTTTIARTVKVNARATQPSGFLFNFNCLIVQFNANGKEIPKVNKHIATAKTTKITLNKIASLNTPLNRKINRSAIPAEIKQLNKCQSARFARLVVVSL